MGFYSFLKTDFNNANDSMMWLGNQAMIPYRSFFKGMSITHVDPTLPRVKESDPHYSQWKGYRKLYLTALAIVSLIPLTVLAVVCKTINYYLSSETREIYRNLVFGTQLTKWKDAFQQDPSVELKDFFIINEKERPLVLCEVLKILQHNPQHGEILLNQVEKLFSQPFSSPGPGWRAITEEIKTLEEVTDPELFKKIIGKMISGIMIDEQQGIAKLKGIIPYIPAAFSQLNSEDRLKVLKNMTTNDPDFSFNYIVDGQCYHTKSDSFDLPISVQEVREILEKAARPETFSDKFLCTALQSDVTRALPLFQAKELKSKFSILNSLPAGSDVQKQCKEEVVKEISTLTDSEGIIKIYSSLEDQSLTIELLKENLSDRQLYDLITYARSIFLIPPCLFKIIPDKKEVIDHIFLENKEILPFFKDYHIYQIYLLKRFFILLNFGSPKVNRINVDWVVLNNFRIELIKSFLVGDEGFKTNLGKLIKLIDPKIIPYLVPDLMSDFGHATIQKDERNCRTLFTYFYFECWAEALVAKDETSSKEKIEKLITHVKETIRYRVPDMSAIDVNDLVDKFFQFCQLMQLFMTHPPFQKELLEKSKAGKIEKLKSALQILNRKMPSLVQICARIIQTKFSQSSDEDRFTIIDNLAIRLPEDFDFQQKFNQIPEEKRSYFSTFSPSLSISSIAEKVGNDREHGVLLLWWFGTNGLITDPKQLYSLTKKSLIFFNNEQLDELKELYNRTPCDNFYFELAIFDLIPEQNKVLVLESVFKNTKESFNIIVDGKKLYRAPSSIYQIRFSSSLFSKIVTKLSQPRGEIRHSSFLRGEFHSCFLIVGLQLMESDFIKKIEEFENMPFENRPLGNMRYFEKKGIGWCIKNLSGKRSLFNYVDYFNFLDYFITNKIQLKDTYTFVKDKLSEDFNFFDEWLFVSLTRSLAKCNPRTLSVFYSILSMRQLRTLLDVLSRGDYKINKKMFKYIPTDRDFLVQLFRISEMRRGRTLAIMPVPAIRYYFSTSAPPYIVPIGFVQDQDEKQLRHVLPYIVPVTPLGVLYQVWEEMVLDIANPAFWKKNKKEALKNIFSLASFNKWKSTMNSEEKYENEAFLKVIPVLELFNTETQQRVLTNFKKYCVIMESFFSYKPFRTLMWEKTKDTDENQSSEEDRRTLAKALSFFNMSTLKRLCLDAVLRDNTPYAGIVPEEVAAELEHLAGLNSTRL